MTTLYRPVLIESAEQAEALPAGTSVKRAVWHESGHQDYCAGVKIGFNTWFTTSPTAERQDALSQYMVGWMALVPIEAEEETLERQRFSQAVPDVLHRFTTPWTLYTPQEPK